MFQICVKFQVLLAYSLQLCEDRYDGCECSFLKQDETVMETAPSSTPRPFDDVESLLRRPFLGESKSGGEPDTGLLPKQGAPDIDKRILDHCKPPYQSENDYSILYRAVVAITIYFAVGILCYYAENDLFGLKTESFIDSV